MKKLTLLIPFAFAMLFSNTAAAQDMPPGALVAHLNCSLNDGVTMPQVVAWARNLPRNGPQPVAEFYRESALNGNFLQNYDFQIATYYQSYSHLVEVVGANITAPANRVQPSIRAEDLYTCNPASNAMVNNRTVNADNDGFTGEATVMHTRFCRLADGNTLADAWEFATDVADNFRRAGNTSIMQLWNRALGPIPMSALQNAGSGVTIAVVPATPQDWGTRWDMGRGGFEALAGVTSPFSSCNYPAVWVTNSVYSSQQQ